MTNIVTDNIDSESLIVMLVALLNDELEVVPVQLWLVQDVVKDTFSFIASQLSGKINRKIGWEYSLFLPQPAKKRPAWEMSGQAAKHKR